MRNVVVEIIKYLISVLPSKVVREVKDRFGTLYFRRNAIIDTKWFSICVHEFYQDKYDSRFDKDPYLHNHPREFWTFVLDNGYVEIKKDDINSSSNHYRRDVGFFGFVNKKCFHQIYSLNGTYARTLTIGLKRTDKWGYLIDGKIISNEDYREDKRRKKANPDN